MKVRPGLQPCLHLYKRIPNAVPLYRRSELSGFFPAVRCGIAVVVNRRIQIQSRQIRNQIQVTKQTIH